MIPTFKFARSLMMASTLLSVLLLLATFLAPKPPEPPEPQLICGNALHFSNPYSRSDSLWIKGEKIFEMNCATCHALHDVVIGPALAGVFERRDSLWVIDATVDYMALMEKGDKEAIALYKEWREISHIRFTELSDEKLKALMTYIKAAP